MGESIKVAQLSELTPNLMKSIRIDRTDIAVVLVDGKLHAFEDTCTHANCSLSPGEVEENDEVICYCHTSIFNYKTGQVLSGPAGRAIRVFPVEVRGDDIFVTL